MSKGFGSVFAPLKQHVQTGFTHLNWITRANWIFLFTVTVTWVLFQKKMLPKPVSRVVSRLFFLPTFPITALMRYGNYWTKIDDTVILGCAPMAILNHPAEMYKIGVRGVVNMCSEYAGPTSSYKNLGMKQLHLPTDDHYEPSLESMVDAMEFIQQHKERGEKVYVHCKAAHGRGASIALCWMMKENPGKSTKVHSAVHQHLILFGYTKTYSYLLT